MHMSGPKSAQPLQLLVGRSRTTACGPQVHVAFAKCADPIAMHATPHTGGELAWTRARDLVPTKAGYSQWLEASLWSCASTASRISLGADG